jgi:hypothetical protein
LATRTLRYRSGLIGVGALLAVLTGTAACGAPQYTYSADYSANTYFKVPHGWHQLRQTDVAAAMKAYGWSAAGAWTSAFDAASSPAAGNFLSFTSTSPFVFAEVGTLSTSASDGLSYNSLEDAFLPVSSSLRSQLPPGYPLTNFQMVSQQRITAAQGVHGIEETYSYTYGGFATDTFDQVALTNADASQFYLLVVHCTSRCFSSNQQAISDVISSFTVRSP